MRLSMFTEGYVYGRGAFRHFRRIKSRFYGRVLMILTFLPNFVFPSGSFCDLASSPRVTYKGIAYFAYKKSEKRRVVFAYAHICTFLVFDSEVKRSVSSNKASSYRCNSSLHPTNMLPILHTFHCGTARAKPKPSQDLQTSILTPPCYHFHSSGGWSSLHKGKADINSNINIDIC